MESQTTVCYARCVIEHLIIAVAIAIMGTPLSSQQDARDLVDKQLDERAALDLRVATIGYRINVANAKNCGRPGFDSGMLLQAADQFPASIRLRVRHHFALGDRVSISGVIPGSPADRAGLRSGDWLLSVAGQSTMRARLDLPGARYSTVFDSLNLIDAMAAHRDRLDVSIARDGRVETRELSVSPGCVMRVQVISSDRIDAYADDHYASITTALARFATDDNELSLFIGHELAHGYLQHEERLKKAAPLYSLFGNRLVPPSTILKTEREADRLGLLLAARAGYDMSNAPSYWRNLAAAFPQGEFFKTHPGTAERARTAQETIDEIRKSGEQGVLR